MALGSAVGGMLLGTVFGFALFAAVLLIAPDGRVGKAHGGGRAMLATFLGTERSLWNGVLPENIVDQQLSMVRNPHYGVHVIALGKNGSLFHKYQTGPATIPVSGAQSSVPMSDWLCLTPNLVPIFGNTSAPTTVVPVFGNSPAVALNADGRIELFVGYQPDSLDLWQMYQTDPKDPLAWSAPRAPYCDPSLTACIKCVAEPACKAHFWNEGYLWTTSQQSLWLDPISKKLKLAWRNFDGHVYEMTQDKESVSTHWRENSVQYATVFE